MDDNYFLTIELIRNLPPELVAKINLMIIGMNAKEMQVDKILKIIKELKLETE